MQSLLEKQKEKEEQEYDEIMNRAADRLNKQLDKSDGLTDPIFTQISADSFDHRFARVAAAADRADAFADY